MRNPVVTWALDVLDPLGFFDEEEEEGDHNYMAGGPRNLGFCSCGWQSKPTTDPRKSQRAHVRRVTR